MTTLPNGTSYLPRSSSFASLFKRYRLRSEIKSLSEFADLLAEEGFAYETSIFTKWQNGDRVPKDRGLLLATLRVFVKQKGIQTVQEANHFIESANQRTLTGEEIARFSSLISTYSTPNQHTSLSNIIRDFRIKNRISYSEITLGMGWDDQSTIQDIENGKIDKPKRDTIDRLCSVLELNPHEKNRLLFAGGYLPSDEEIINIRKATKDAIESWPYPCVLIDFSWRIISENNQNQKLLNYSPDQFNKILESKPSIIEVQFDPSLSIMGRLEESDKEKYKEALVQMLVQFRLTNHIWKNEEWYQELLSKMHNNNLFREAWEKSMLEESKKITKAGTKIFPHPKGLNKNILLEFVVVPLIEDPRFEIEYLFPIDNYSFQYFRKDLI